MCQYVRIYFVFTRGVYCGETKRRRWVSQTRKTVEKIEKVFFFPRRQHYINTYENKIAGVHIILHVPRFGRKRLKFSKNIRSFTFLKIFFEIRVYPPPYKRFPKFFSAPDKNKNYIEIMGLKRDNLINGVPFEVCRDTGTWWLKKGHSRFKRDVRPHYAVNPILRLIDFYIHF